MCFTLFPSRNRQNLLPIGHRQQNRVAYISTEHICHVEDLRIRRDKPRVRDPWQHGLLWGYNSVGRVSALQAGSHGFKSHYLHSNAVVAESGRKAFALRANDASVSAGSNPVGGVMP